MLLNVLLFIARQGGGSTGSRFQQAAETTKAAIPGIEWPLMWGAIVLVALLLIAILWSNAIPFRPSGTDNSTRKIIFWIFAVATPIVAFVTNYFTCHVYYTEQEFKGHFVVENGQDVVKKMGELLTNVGLVSLCSFVAFVVIGFILSKAFKSSKLGSWF